MILFSSSVSSHLCFFSAFSISEDWHIGGFHIFGTVIDELLLGGIYHSFVNLSVE